MYFFRKTHCMGRSYVAAQQLFSLHCKNISTNNLLQCFCAVYVLCMCVCVKDKLTPCCGEHRGTFSNVNNLASWCVSLIISIIKVTLYNWDSCLNRYRCCVVASRRRLWGHCRWKPAHLMSAGRIVLEQYHRVVWYIRKTLGAIWDGTYENGQTQTSRDVLLHSGANQLLILTHDRESAERHRDRSTKRSIQLLD